ncbi:MAG: PDZ domain-containing protein, partial [Bradymonadaceae bacterium]
RDGEAHGLRLVGVTPNSVFSQLGIRSGDVIHSINGTSLSNQRQALDLLDSMRRENNVVIEVERRGSRQKYEYNIK